VRCQQLQCSTRHKLHAIAGVPAVPPPLAPLDYAAWRARGRVPPAPPPLHTQQPGANAPGRARPLAPRCAARRVAGTQGTAPWIRAAARKFPAPTGAARTASRSCWVALAALLRVLHGVVWRAHRRAGEDEAIVAEWHARVVRLRLACCLVLAVCCALGRLLLRPHACDHFAGTCTRAPHCLACPGPRGHRGCRPCRPPARPACIAWAIAPSHLHMSNSAKWADASGSPWRTPRFEKMQRSELCIWSCGCMR
jgi:hypothetical protein